MKFSIKNVLYYISFVVSIILIYGVYDYIFNKPLVETLTQRLVEDDLLEFYKKYNIKVDKKNNTLIKNNKVVYYNNLNTLHAKLFCKNKFNVSTLLQENNIPNCKMIKWSNKLSNVANIKIINAALKFPLVIKPISNQEGRDVITDINDNNSLVKNVKHLNNIKGEYNIMIEEQHFGNKYRIFILNNKFVVVKKESPPIIVGDGKSTIQKLINNYHVINNTKPIVHINESLIDKQGYVMNDILENKKQINVTNVVSPSNGSNEDFIDINSINKVNLQMFLNVCRLLKLNICGIDFITKDINIPYTICGKIIEVNAGPGISTPLLGNKDATNRLAEALFSEKRFN